MKKLKFLLGLVLLLSFSLVGCASNNDSASGSAANSSKTTITFWNRYPELNEPFKKFIANFEKENKNIHVKLVNVSVEAAPAQYQAAISDNSLPDLFTTVTSVSLKKLVDLDRVHELDSIITPQVKDQFVQGSWNANASTLNGKTYVLPLYSPSHATYVLYYNKDVLKKFGISESDIPKSWADMEKVGKTIYKKSNGQVYGLIANKDNWALTNIVNQLATTVSPDTPQDINYKTGRPTFNSQGAVETIEYLKSLYSNKVLAPQSLESDESTATALFSSGQAAFYMMGNWEGANLVNTNNFKNWGVSSLPTKNGEPFYHVSGATANGIEVAKNTNHWPEVQKFLQYCLDHVYSDVVVAPGITAPAKKGVVESAKLPYPQYKGINDLMNAGSLPVPTPFEKNINTVEFMETYKGQLQKVNIGNVTLGYLSGQIKDLKSELNNINSEANKAFDKTLTEKTNVKAEDFQFADWSPMKAYTGGK
jgi:ABC-type glycerol-3-phosphate transport system substrate-binding protein